MVAKPQFFSHSSVRGMQSSEICADSARAAPSGTGRRDRSGVSRWSRAGEIDGEGLPDVCHGVCGAVPVRREAADRPGVAEPGEYLGIVAGACDTRPIGDSANVTPRKGVR